MRRLTGSGPGKALVWSIWLFLGWSAAFWSGHALPPLTHLYYLPIVLMAWWNGVAGGLIGGALATLLTLGMQLLWQGEKFLEPALLFDAFLRLVTYLAVGLVAGWLASDTGRGLVRREHEYQELADHHLRELEGWEQEQKRLLQRLRDLDRQVRDLAVLRDAASRLSAARTPEAVAQVVADTGAKVFPTDFFGVFLVREGDGTLVAAQVCDVADRCPEGTVVEAGQGIVGWVAAHGEFAHSLDVESDTQYQASPWEQEFRSFTAFPVVVQQKVSGVLAVGRSGDPPLDQNQVFLLRGLAEQAGMAWERVLLHQELERLARTDGLTGLLNRRSFDEALVRELHRAARYRLPLSLILLDVDHFKHYNDQNGHPAGDGLLQAVAQLISRQVRAVDVVARYGGEEFALILPETSGSAAVLLAERIRKAVAQQDFPGGSRQPCGRVTVSLGVAAYPDSATTAEGLLHEADQALYRAKAGGRNRVEAAVQPEHR
ncbi:MAG: sensor domain-containing diguanylate cyclase [Bacillota bacterium]|nr:sensor domain-containing diguanylate cyclase [Bacillota bacterium]